MGITLGGMGLYSTRQGKLQLLVYLSAVLICKDTVGFLTEVELPDLSPALDKLICAE